MTKHIIVKIQVCYMVFINFVIKYQQKKTGFNVDRIRSIYKLWITLETLEKSC